LTLACQIGTVAGPKQNRTAATVTKTDLVRRLAEANPHLTRREVQIIVTTVFDEITAALLRGDRVELRGFGVFCQEARRAHGPGPAHPGAGR
jgi:hypothetical protein